MKGGHGIVDPRRSADPRRPSSPATAAHHAINRPLINTEQNSSTTLATVNAAHKDSVTSTPC